MRKYIISLIFLIFLFCFYSNFTLASEVKLDRGSVEENVSREMRYRIKGFLDRYYEGKSYLVNVDTYLDRASKAEIESGETPMSSDFRIKSISVTISLNEDEFSRKDFEFIEAVIVSQAGLDATRGDSVVLTMIPFKDDYIYKKDRGHVKSIGFSLSDRFF